MISFATKHNDPKASLGWGERICYGAGNYGMAWVNNLMSAFFMMYLTNVAFVPITVASSIIAFSKLFDGVSDLLMGRIVDKTKSKYGKGRVWLVRMCIPMAISTFLLFYIPADWTNMVKYVYMFIFYNLVNSVFYTSMYVPYNAMNYLMTANDFDRGLLGNMQQIFMTIACLCLNTFFIKWLAFFGEGDQYTQKAWTGSLIVVGILVVVSSVICFLGTKERAQAGVAKEEKKDEVPAMVAVKALFKNKYWVQMVVCMFLIFFTIVMYASTGAYYAQYVLGDLSYFTPISNAISAAQFAIMFFTPMFMKKFGKHRTYQVGLLFMILGFAGTGLVGSNAALLIFFNAVKGLGLGAAGGMAFGMVSDTVEYGKLTTGVEAVGMGNAGVSTAQKLGLGLGQAVMGWIFAAGGFDATLEVQNASAINAIVFVYNWIPVICIALCSICMLFYKLDEELPGLRSKSK